MFGQVKGQEEQRRVEHFVDQHGREYVANVEITTGDPCEVLKPLFTAPLGPDWFVGKLIPPEKYRKMVPRHLRGRKRYQVEIDYVQWLNDLDERSDDYEIKMSDLVKGASGGGANLVEMIKSPPPIIRDLAGAPPFPPRVIVQAMQAGNEWALGFSERVPAKVDALLAELKPVVTRSRRANEAVAFDPLADEDAGDFEGELVAANMPDPLDELNDLEELHDPDAMGGKRVPVGRRGRK